MNEEEAKLKLEYLISKYIEDDEKKRELIDLVRKRGASIAKGVLADIQSYKKVPYTKEDSDIMHDIVFHYV